MKFQQNLSSDLTSKKVIASNFNNNRLWINTTPTNLILLFLQRWVYEFVKAQ